MSPEYRGRPIRACLMHVERGNPVEGPAAVQFLQRRGGLTVREADVLGGNRRTREANAGVSKGDGKAPRPAVSFGCAADNRPDTNPQGDLVVRPERALTRVG